MMRISALARSLSSTRYLVNHKKPMVEMPSTKPPKYIYHVEYLKTAPPTFDEGFTDHTHTNPFEDEAMNRYELYRFSYSGQQWYINPGSVFLSLCFFAYLYYVMVTGEEENRKWGRQGLLQAERIPDLIIPSQNVKVNF